MRPSPERQTATKRPRGVRLGSAPSTSRLPSGALATVERLYVRSLILAAVALVGQSQAAGQIAASDSLRQIADSVRVVSDQPDSLVIGPTAGYFRDNAGTPLNTGHPARRASLGLVELLTEEPGMMPFSFGSAGWPGSFSPFGLNPNRMELALDDRLVNDLVTGRPRFDLLPYALIDEIRVDPTSPAATYGIRASSGSFSSGEPVTDLRYSSSGTGLQAIDAVHAQSRRFTVFGPADRIELLFGYAGAAADGEYPGSRLERARQIQSRIRFSRELWSVEIYELYNRRNVGAHGGVLPRSGQPYSSIYQRIGSSVENPEAMRTTVRNDLSVRLRTLAFVVPIRVDGFWSAQTLQYRASSDTVTARVRRAGIAASTDVEFGKSSVSLKISAWLDRYRSGNAFQNGFDEEAASADFIAIGKTSAGEFDATGQIGIHSDNGRSFLSGSGEVTYNGFFVRGSSTGLRSNWMDRAGFGPDSTPFTAIPDARLDRISLGAQQSVGPLHVAIEAFLNRETDASFWTYNPATEETVGFSNVVAWTTVGLALDLTFRSPDQLGVYGLVRPSVSRRTTEQSITNSEEYNSSTVPEFWMNGRLGIHTLLFKGDLDLDLSGRIFYWDSMVGRRLDPRTGILMQPSNAASIVPSSWTFDIVAEAGVRTATLFFAYENIFSGTNALVGNLLIPDYPLPAQRFRFGVFWPISN